MKRRDGPPTRNTLYLDDSMAKRFEENRDIVVTGYGKRVHGDRHPGSRNPCVKWSYTFNRWVNVCG